MTELANTGAVVDEVGQRLRTPVASCTPETLAQSWQQVDCLFTIPGHGILVGDPALAGRIRGGIGNVLLDAAAPHERRGAPSPYSPPSAFDIFFRKQGRIDPAFELAAPWVISTDASGADLLVRLSIFGFACDYAPAMAELVSIALQRKIDWVGRNKVFLPDARVEDRSLMQPSLRDSDTLVFPLSEEHGEVIMRFLTPVVVSGSDARRKSSSLLSTFPARLSGLARWHDMALELDRDAYADAVRELRFTWQEAQTVKWTRGSRKQDRTMRMSGTIGDLILEGPLQALSLLCAPIAIAEQTHLGGDIAFGCGRFSIPD